MGLYRKARPDELLHGARVMLDPPRVSFTAAEVGAAVMAAEVSIAKAKRKAPAKRKPAKKTRR